MSTEIAIFASFYAANHAFFVLAILFFFKHQKSRNTKLLALSAIGLSSILSQLFGLTRTSIAFNFVEFGFTLLVLSFALFAWVVVATPRHRLSVAGETTSQFTVIRTGPFRFFRHPCYLAYTMTWLGPLAISQNLYTGAPVFIMIAFYYIIARAEEIDFLSSSAREDYERHCHSVTWLGPRITTQGLNVRRKSS